MYEPSGSLRAAFTKTRALFARSLTAKEQLKIAGDDARYLKQKRYKRKSNAQNN